MKSLENEREFKTLIDDLKQSRSELLGQQKRLENLNVQLRDTNRALSYCSKHRARERRCREEDRREIKKSHNTHGPEAENDKALARYEGQLDMLTMQIEDLTSGFTMDSRVAAVLSFTELRVASLIKNGITTEDIARQLHISESTVRTHRKNIRKKLK